MVDEDEDLDLDVEPSSSSDKTKNIIIVVLAALLLIGASIGGTLFFLGGGGDGPAAEKQVEEVKETKVEEKVRDVVKKPIYLALQTMVVNFANPKPARYLQVDIQLMAHEQQVLQAVEENMPVVRNDILVLLGGQSYDGINTREGKEALRKEILAAVNRIIKQQAGIKGTLKGVYFTSFVMQ